MPPSLREWLPPDHLVWFVLATVEELDTTRFHARHPVAGPGRRAFDPDMLLAVLIYAYACGERSSRRIEAACGDSAAFQVLCGRDVPDHTVIARFRAAHEELFSSLFSQVLQMCGRAGMGRFGVVAIDGTKIAASASIFANRGEDSLRDEADRIAAQVVAEAARVDADEDAEYGDARGDEVAPEFRDPATRAAAIKAALDRINAEKAQQAEAQARQAQQRAEAQRARAEAARAKLADLEAQAAERMAAWQRAHDRADTEGTPRPQGRPPVPVNDKLRAARRAWSRCHERATSPTSSPTGGAGGAGGYKANVTDPDSRIMKTRNGWIQGYNAQLAVSEDYLIIAVELTQDTNDLGQFKPMMTAAQAGAATVTAATPDTGATPNTPDSGDSGDSGDTVGQAAGGIGLLLADAGYCSEDNLTAAGPDRLIATGKDRKLVAEAAEDPRAGAPPEQASAVEQMRHRTRTPEGLAAYRRRGALVEPVNAHIKDQTGLRRFSRRGLTAANSELQLAAAVVNLLKLHIHLDTPPAEPA